MSRQCIPHAMAIAIGDSSQGPVGRKIEQIDQKAYS